MNSIIELSEFVNEIRPAKPVSFETFLQTYNVRVGKNIVPLKTYIAKKSIKTENLALLFSDITNIEAYLERFYNMSLKIKDKNIHFGEHYKPMQIKQINNNQEPLLKNLIRNLHFKHILELTKSGIENVPTYMDVLKDLLRNKIIDYKILTPSSLYYIEKRRFGSVLSSYYFRASILNPYVIYSLNENLLKGEKIFTPTLGWSSYACGFLESSLAKEYVGTDVIPDVCKKTDQLIADLYPSAKKDIYCKPSEDLAKSKRFMKKYTNHFDVVFFSPPYYKLELYEGKNQSTNKYNTYQEWLDKYWEATIQLCKQVLSNNGKLCYILSGYGSSNTREQYDLIKDMNSITTKYFKQTHDLPMYNKNVHVTTHKQPSERILIFS
jgi:hypothetical protein|uniref:Type II methyltransferase M.TaqI-like domain-containing protein n=1 Tax=viral metagenome TaxID=1070528 RepID=A0A6C0IJ09_9ZZZZ